jgi:DNA-directed RNA polymerase subunit N (RpoN/RPB10)
VRSFFKQADVLNNLLAKIFCCQRFIFGNVRDNLI